MFSVLDSSINVDDFKEELLIDSTLKKLINDVKFDTTKQNLIFKFLKENFALECIDMLLNLDSDAAINETGVPKNFWETLKNRLKKSILENANSKADIDPTTENTRMHKNNTSFSNIAVQPTFGNINSNITSNYFNESATIRQSTSVPTTGIEKTEIDLHNEINKLLGHFESYVTSHCQPNSLQKKWSDITTLFKNYEMNKLISNENENYKRKNNNKIKVKSNPAEFSNINSDEPSLEKQALKELILPDLVIELSQYSWDLIFIKKFMKKLSKIHHSTYLKQFDHNTLSKIIKSNSLFCNLISSISKKTAQLLPLLSEDKLKIFYEDFAALIDMKIDISCSNRSKYKYEFNSYSNKADHQKEPEIKEEINKVVDLDINKAKEEEISKSIPMFFSNSAKSSSKNFCDFLLLPEVEKKKIIEYINCNSSSADIAAKSNEICLVDYNNIKILNEDENTNSDILSLKIQNNQLRANELLIAEKSKKIIKVDENGVKVSKKRKNNLKIDDSNTKIRKTKIDRKSLLKKRKAEYLESDKKAIHQHLIKSKTRSQSSEISQPAAAKGSSETSSEEESADDDEDLLGEESSSEDDC